MTMMRYALVGLDESQAEVLSRYLPSNYELLGFAEHEDRPVAVIGGRDNAGWSLDGYVLPRLASGLYFGKEIDLSHPVMKQIPDETVAR